MKTFRENTRLLLVLLLLLFGPAGGSSAQLLYQNENSSLLQINQPLALDLRLASTTVLTAKLELPVSLLLVTGSATQQISLDPGFFASLPEVFNELASEGFSGAGSHIMPRLRSKARQLTPAHWRLALAGALAGFFWLVSFFVEGKIAGTARDIARDPARALFGGFCVVAILLLTIALSFYSVFAAPLGLILLLLMLLLAAVSPVVIIAAICEAFVPGISGLKKWLLMAIFSILVAGLLLNKFAWFSFLPVALALTASSLRNSCKDCDFKEVSDES